MRNNGALNVAYAVRRNRRYGGRAGFADGGAPGEEDAPLFLQSGVASAPPQQSRLLDPFSPMRVRGPVEAIGDALDYKKPWTVGGALQALMMAMPMGRGVQPMQNGAVNPVIPMRPFKPNTYFPDEPPRAANMNPPSKLRWNDQEVGGPLNVGGDTYFQKPPIPKDPVRGEPGFSHAPTDRGENLAGIVDRWKWNGGNDSHYTYQPQVDAPSRGGSTPAHYGPQFRSRDVAKQYAEQLLQGGRFGKHPDPAFAAPFLEQDAAALRQLLAERERQKLSLVPTPKEPGMARGGGLGVAYSVRRQNRAEGGGVHEGPIHSAVPGRTDNHPMDVAEGAYVVPAETVSHLGENNTAAGMEVLNSMFGPESEIGGGAAGGEANPVPINAAGGEFVIPPEVVSTIGGGDIKRGHEILDQWVMGRRKEHIKALRGLPGPAKS